MGLFRELRYELSSLIFGLGILAMIFSLTQYLIPTQSPDWLQSIHRAVGNYVVWEAFLGFLAVLGGGFYFVDTIRKEREFERLISTPSKEVFVKPVEFAASLRILGEDEMDLDRVCEGAGDDVPQLVESPSGPRGNRDGRPMEFRFAEHLGLRGDLTFGEEVGFRQDGPHRIRGDLREQGARGQADLAKDLVFG